MTKLNDIKELIKNDEMISYILSNKDVMLKAIDIYGLEAVKYASNDLKCNPDFMQKAIDIDNERKEKGIQKIRKR